MGEHRAPSRLRDEFITVREASRRTGRSRYTIYNWLDTKKVEGIRVGRARYIRIASLIEFIGEEAAEICGLKKTG